MDSRGRYSLRRSIHSLLILCLFSLRLTLAEAAVTSAQDIVPSRSSPRNLRLTPTKLTTVTLKWDAPLNGGVYNYDVNYWRGQDQSQVRTKNVSNSTSCDVGDLQIRVNYTFSVSISGSPELVTNEVTGSGISPRPPTINKDGRMITELKKVETENAKFRCSVDAYPKPNITWWRGNVRLETGDDREVKRATMTINDVVVEDSGVYSCYVTNDYGELRVNFTLEVDPDDSEVYFSSNSESSYGAIESTVSDLEPMAPEFNKDKYRFHDNMLKVAGERLTLKCPYRANPRPTVVWTKNDKLNWEQQSNFRDRVTINDFKLIIERLMPSVDQAKYTCIVTNELGSIEHTTIIDITERIATRPIISQIDDQEVVVGSNVSFECKIVSDATPHIVWLKMEKPGNVSQLQTMTDRLDLIVHTSQNLKVQTQTLKIYNVSFKDSGLYTCLAGNYLGITRASATLSVIAVTTHPPPTSAPVVAIVRPGHWDQQKTVMVVAIVCSFIILILFFFIFIMCYKSNQRHTRSPMRVVNKTQLIRQLSTESGHSTAPLVIGRSRLSSSLTVVSEYEVPLDPEWEFPRDRLTLGKALGEGAFGKVVLAEAVGISNKEQTTMVAVKMLKGNATDRELSDLVSELEMMKMIGKHTNIINLLGCSTQDGPLFVIVEYAHHGNLRDFLRLRRPPDNNEMTVMLPDREQLTNKDLISMAYQVARGMEFLASKKAIHRDLAARNVLVTENYIMKIADFGLARDVHYIDFYKKTTDGRLPVKWMAPEALFDRVFTTQSDVWSFGILLWEIITLGGTPYPSVPVEKMFDYLKMGKRLEQPQNCSLEIYHIMRECWHTSPGLRPTFFDLVEDLARIISLASTQDYLDLEALGDAPVTTFVDVEFDSGNSSQHSRHSSESTV
ncbi:fibroblast growth factor receptor-like isoform X2 [Patiria miniata]|uniref:Fibroblast growth factor receptor n=1 Tax=Patiria miniata TaxID=46514 RepID=A0A913Z574_PATMI|nr:fibroblast growth factor receptor-like isoform X2 [Patiria miniata]